MDMYNGLSLPPLPDKFQTQKDMEDYLDTLNTFLDQMLNKTKQYYHRPRQMTTTERNALATPVTGDLVYNTTTNKMNFYDGSVWKEVTNA